MTLTEITHHRLANQQIATHQFGKPAEIVEWLGAIQAQEYALSKWAIGLRLPGSKEDEIEKALSAGTILRTHLLRPTWHFVAPADIRWMLALTAPRVNVANAFMYRKMELDQPIFNRANDVLAKTLQGGKHLTRPALQKALAQKKIIADGVRLVCIMMHAELDGIICSGARSGNQFTYALLDERVAPGKQFDGDEALAELTTRYFNSRGPGTLNDFAVWSGLTKTLAKKGLEMALPAFEKEKVGDEDYYFQPGTDVDKNGIRQAWLLPPYDEYIMGYKNKEPIFISRNKIPKTPTMLFNNTIVIEGQIAGSWRRTIQKNTIHLEYHLFKPSNKKQSHLLKQSIRKFSRFMDLPVTEIEK
ncbi:MAG: Winged helix DNA-binding protein [Ferruginibacter sp.]|nr:Winged helix DNA-binding protein [Ferruginibacter sp.]